MYQLFHDPQVTELRFGGEIGSETVALETILDLRGPTFKKPHLKVVVANTLEGQPGTTIPISQRADEIVALRNRITKADGYHAYRLRNAQLIKGVDLLIGFWAGTEAWPLHALQIAKLKQVPFEIVKLGTLYLRTDLDDLPLL